MKQSCFIAKVCNREHIGVNLFSLQSCVHEYRLPNVCEKKAHDLFQDFFLCIHCGQEH